MIVEGPSLIVLSIEASNCMFVLYVRSLPNHPLSYMMTDVMFTVNLVISISLNYAGFKMTQNTVLWRKILLVMVKIC